MGCWCEVFREPGSGPTSSVLHWGFCSRNLQAPEMELFIPGRARRVTGGGVDRESGSPLKCVLKDLASSREG